MKPAKFSSSRNAEKTIVRTLSTMRHAAVSDNLGSILCQVLIHPTHFITPKEEMSSISGYTSTGNLPGTNTFSQNENN
jgi:hypothetical protein